jgi:hypothetical protein
MCKWEQCLVEQTKVKMLADVDSIQAKLDQLIEKYGRVPKEFIKDLLASTDYRFKTTFNEATMKPNNL